MEQHSQEHRALQGAEGFLLSGCLVARLPCTCVGLCACTVIRASLFTLLQPHALQVACRSYREVLQQYAAHYTGCLPGSGSDHKRQASVADVHSLGQLLSAHHTPPVLAPTPW